MKNGWRTIGLSALALFCWATAATAEYTIVLKNGRRITVQSYREEGGMIKAYGLGGEIGIRKEQIQSILEGGEQPGIVSPKVESVPSGPPGKPGIEEKKGRPVEPPPRVSSPEEELKEERAKEEKGYQDKLTEITAQIKALRDQYALATRGTASPEPGLLQGENAIKARTDDLMSRWRDVQHNPAGSPDAGPMRLETPSPFAGQPSTVTELRPGEPGPEVDSPPPPYTVKEKELSDLRNQLIQLQKERETLIEEMKQKGFETGSLFLE